MKRKLATMLLLAALIGWSSQAARAGKYMSQAWSTPTDGARWGQRSVNEAPNLVGAWGQPVPITAPEKIKEPTGAEYARMMLAQSHPAGLLQQAGYNPPPGLMGGPPMPGVCPPGGCPTPGAGGFGGAGAMGGYGGRPGMPNPGMPAGAVAAVGALTGPGQSPYAPKRTEIRFVGPAGMKISWYAPSATGGVAFTPQYLEAPARYNFVQAAIYRLKLSDIVNRPGVELYPTLEVYPATAKTVTFLAHAAVPVSFTDEDFEQVAAGNFVVKVVYLPDPQYQDLAATGPDEVVSSRLEPGVDPILEAKRRGSILAIVRLGNIDLEAPNTPAMDAPPAGAGFGPGMGMMAPGMLPPGVKLPPGVGASGGVGAPTVPVAPGALPKTVPLNLPPKPPTGTPLGKLPTSGGIVPTNYSK